MKPSGLWWLLSALHICSADADDGGQHTLSVTAEGATVSVPPQPSQRHFFDLPSLDYVFRVEARCHDDWEAASLSLNVADSRVTRSAAELAGAADHELSLEIPARQLAPVAMRDFCVIEQPAEGSAITEEAPDAGRGTAALTRGQMTIDAALSVHASLRCRLGEEQRIVYVTEPLDVTLHCERPEPPGVATTR
jgi:hypothetical protein